MIENETALSIGVAGKSDESRKPQYKDCGGSCQAFLISTSATDSEYPSTQQTADRQITITVIVKQNGSPKSGVTVNFTSIDIDDESSYEPDTDVPDNGGGAGSVDPASGTTGVDGKVQTVLTITNRYAGDNYKVKAKISGDPDSAARYTGPLVAWKRVYVEKDQMYKSGTHLSSDFTADGDNNPDTISVVDASGFAANDTIIIFDADHPNGETAMISSINGNNIVLTSDLTSSYNAGYGAGDKGAAIVKQGTD